MYYIHCKYEHWTVNINSTTIFVSLRESVGTLSYSPVMLDVVLKLERLVWSRKLWYKKAWCGSPLHTEKVSQSHGVLRCSPRMLAFQSHQDVKCQTCVRLSGAEGKFPKGAIKVAIHKIIALISLIFSSLTGVHCQDCGTYAGKMTAECSIYYYPRFLCTIPKFI